MTKKAIAYIVLGLILIWSSSAYQTGAQPQTPPSPTKGQKLPQSGVRGVQKGVTVRRPSKPSKSMQLSPQATVLNEDFEGDWLSNWYVEDFSNGDNGYYVWGQRDCLPHTGNYSVWAAGGGDGASRTCFDDYPNYLNSWATYTYTLDLSQATSAFIRFQFFGRSEDAVDDNGDPYDGLFVGSSTDGFNFNGTVFYRDWTDGDQQNGYWEYTIDLSNRLGESQVWIAFQFFSDVNVTDIGFFVDDFEVHVDDAATATPTTIPPTNTPTTAPPTSTPTNTPTRTPQFNPAAALYLPIVRRPQVVTVTPTPTATPTRVVTVTPTSTPVPIACPDNEPNNRPANAKVLSQFGRSCYGNFNSPATDSDDWYKVHLKAGQARFEVVVPAGDTYTLYLFDQVEGQNKGNHIAEMCPPPTQCKSTGSGVRTLTATIPAEGDYYVEVYGRIKQAADHTYYLKVVN